MSGWRAALVALIVGGLILGAGYLIPRLGQDTADSDLPDEDISGLTLACVPALSPACEAIGAELDIQVASWTPGQSLPDRHVLLAPAADLTESLEPGPVVAQSPIVIGSWLDRSSILLSRCGALDLECVASNVGRRWEAIGGNDAWGDFKIGLADPTASEAGMLAWASIQPLADRQRLAQSLRLVTADDDSLTEDLVLFGDSRADLVITTEVAVFNQFQNAIGRGGRLEVFYPASSPWVEYVVSASGFGSGRLVDQITGTEVGQILAAAGVRPAAGTYAYPEPLGQPGTKASVPSSSTRGTLIEAWERTR
jgi:hypothetical protein